MRNSLAKGTLQASISDYEKTGNASYVTTFNQNFSIIEEKLETINSFYKIERGTIINTSLIRYIDYKEETIIFRDFSILYVSKIKLKKIEEDLNLTKNRLYL